jgi:RNA polymerase sigma-70 factor (ECF subfamily)
MTPPSAGGQPVDLEATYAQTRRSLLSYLRRLSGDVQLAEDLMQDVMVKALTALRDRGEAPRDLGAWLHRVAHNAAMDHYRRLRPERPLDEDDAEGLPADSPDPDELAEQAAREVISQCLRPIAQRLPDTYREVVLASEFDGRLLQDIADELGISLAATRQRASRGRRLLRDSLQQCCQQLVAEAGLPPAQAGPVPVPATSPGPREGCGCADRRTCR